jgi:hypothetical protein
MTETDLAEVEPILSTMELNLEHAAKRLSAVQPRRCECIDLTLRALCERHAMEPSPETRGLILRAQIRTRSDALSVLSLLETSDDPLVAQHLLRMTRLYLEAA